MQKKGCESWIKYFVVSFVLVCLVWYAGSLLLYGTLENITYVIFGLLPVPKVMLYAFFISIVIATAQYVLEPSARGHAPCRSYTSEPVVRSVAKKSRKKVSKKRTSSKAKKSTKAKKSSKKKKK
jgi:hypothetical protein